MRAEYPHTGVQGSAKWSQGWLSLGHHVPAWNSEESTVYSKFKLGREDTVEVCLSR